MHGGQSFLDLKVEVERLLDRVKKSHNPERRRALLKMVSMLLSQMDELQSASDDCLPKATRANTEPATPDPVSGAESKRRLKVLYVGRPAR